MVKKWNLWVLWTVHGTHWYAEKWMKIQILRLLFTLFYCSYPLVHRSWDFSCPMNSAQALVLKKKKKKKRAKRENAKSKPHLCIDWSLGNLFTWLIWDLSVFRVWIEDFVINLWFHIYGSRNSVLKNLVEL